MNTPSAVAPSLAAAAAPDPVQSLSTAEQQAFHARLLVLVASSNDRIRRLYGGRDLPELPEGVVVWLKRAEPARPSVLIRLYNLAMSPVPLLRSVPNPGGVAALDNERRRLASLAAQGVPVPRVLDSGVDWTAMSSAGDESLQGRLDRLLRDGNQAGLLQNWCQGLDAIARAHACGAYLSQCFARNMVIGIGPDEAETVSFIDFEEDPGEIMSVAQAQVRDWALYVHSTAFFLADKTPAATAMAARITAADDAVRGPLVTLMRRLRWLLRVLPDARWLGRDLHRAREAGLLLHAVLVAMEGQGQA